MPLYLTYDNTNFTKYSSELNYEDKIMPKTSIEIKNIPNIQLVITKILPNYVLG